VAKGRSTAAEVAQRIDTIMTMLLRGAPRKEMVGFAEEMWGVSDTTADNYIAKATAQIETIVQPRREYEFGLMRTRLEDLYAKTTKIQDYYTALRVLKQIADLTGVDAPTKAEAEVNGAIAITVRYEDVDRG
jgi:hypothetical protein